jgi:hypothetical protein
LAFLDYGFLSVDNAEDLSDDISADVGFEVFTAVVII